MMNSWDLSGRAALLERLLALATEWAARQRAQPGWVWGSVVEV